MDHLARAGQGGFMQAAGGLAALIFALFALAAPASAAGGYVCASPDEKVRLTVVVGRGVAPAVLSARLEVEGRIRVTGGEGDAGIAVGQGWIDTERILLDLADSQVLDYVARLRVLRTGGVLDYGFIETSGRIFPVSCETDA